MRYATLGLALLVTFAFVGCGGDSPGGGGGGPAAGPAGVYDIDREHLEKAALAAATAEMPPGTEMPPEIIDMIKKGLAAMTVNVTINKDATWAASGTSGDGDTIDESGTWTESGGTITFNTTKKEGKDHTDSKDGKYKDGVILMRPEKDAPELRFVRK